MLNRFDTLGYGTQLILDGFQADAESLVDADLLSQVLRDLGALLDDGPAAGSVLVDLEGDVLPGFSVGAVQHEAQVAIHTFSANRKLSLAAFSRHDMAVDAVTSVFRHRFGVGRYESRVHARARLLPHDEPSLRRAIYGDRTYTRLRLRDLPNTGR